MVEPMADPMANPIVEDLIEGLKHGLRNEIMINAAATGANDVEALFQLEIPEEITIKLENLVKVGSQEKVGNLVEAKIHRRDTNAKTPTR